MIQIRHSNAREFDKFGLIWKSYCQSKVLPDIVEHNLVMIRYHSDKLKVLLDNQVNTRLLRRYKLKILY